MMAKDPAMKNFPIITSVITAVDPAVVSTKREKKNRYYRIDIEWNVNYK